MLDAAPARWGAAPERTDPPAAALSSKFFDIALSDPLAASFVKVDALASVCYVSAGSTFLSSTKM